jgi:hypothetical protein
VAAARHFLGDVATRASRDNRFGREDAAHDEAAHGRSRFSGRTLGPGSDFAGRGTLTSRRLEYRIRSLRHAIVQLPRSEMAVSAIRTRKATEDVNAPSSPAPVAAYFRAARGLPRSRRVGRRPTDIGARTASRSLGPDNVPIPNASSLARATRRSLVILILLSEPIVPAGTTTEVAMRRPREPTRSK